MMNKKHTINDVLNDLCFTEKEKQAFIECIQLVKTEQEHEHEGINVEDEIKKIIREVTKDEIQKDNI